MAQIQIPSPATANIPMQQPSMQQSYAAGQKLNADARDKKKLQRIYNVLSGGADPDDRSWFKKASDTSNGIDFVPMTIPEAEQELAVLNPEMHIKYMANKDAKNKELQESISKFSVDIYDMAKDLKNMPLEERAEIIDGYVESLRSEYGDDFPELDKALAKFDPDKDGMPTDKELTKLQNSVRSFQEKKEEDKANISAISPENYELSSIDKYNKSKDYSDLVPRKKETKYEDVYDSDGVIVAQMNKETGKIESHPLAEDKKKKETKYEDVYDENGVIVAQQNTETGKIESHPLAEKNDAFRKPDFSSFTKPDGTITNIDINSKDGAKQAREIISQGGMLTPGDSFTEVQGKTAGFALRMENDEDIFASLDMEQFASLSSRLIDFVPEGLRFTDRQKYEQGKLDFINAQLRRESGAAIAEHEFDSANIQYFPMPGNGQEVVAQKARNRKAVIAAMKVEAGYAFTKIREFLPRTVKILGKEYVIGITITNNKGENGIVEQDGSITPLK